MTKYCKKCGRKVVKAVFQYWCAGCKRWLLKTNVTKIRIVGEKQ